MKFGVQRSYTSKLCLTPTMFSEIEKEPRALSVTQGGPQGMTARPSAVLKERSVAAVHVSGCWNIRKAWQVFKSMWSGPCKIT